MKKKLLAIIMMTVLSFSVTACGGVLDIAKDMNKNNESGTINEVHNAVIVDEEDVSVTVNEIEYVIEEEIKDENTSENSTIMEVVVNDTKDEEISNEGTSESEGTLTFTVPEGYTYNEDEQIYYSEDSYANIIYTTVDDNSTFAYLSETVLEIGLESSLTSQFGEEIDVTITSWEELTIAGCSAKYYTIEYTFSNIPIIQKQVIICGADMIHYLTYSNMNNADSVDEFDAVVDSIQFEK